MNTMKTNNDAYGSPEVRVIEFTQGCLLTGGSVTPDATMPDPESGGSL